MYSYVYQCISMYSKFLLYIGIFCIKCGLTRLEERGDADIQSDNTLRYR